MLTPRPLSLHVGCASALSDTRGGPRNWAITSASRPFYMRLLKNTVYLPCNKCVSLEIFFGFSTFSDASVLNVAKHAEAAC